MILLLKRLDQDSAGQFGHITASDGTFECVSLERPDVEIPVGTYPVTLYDSPEHGLTPLLHNVPNRNFIEIHEGNWASQSKGCILVGKSRAVIQDKEGIAASMDTKKALVALLQALKEDVSITVS